MDFAEIDRKTVFQGISRKSSFTFEKERVIMFSGKLGQYVCTARDAGEGTEMTRRLLEKL